MINALLPLAKAEAETALFSGFLILIATLAVIILSIMLFVAPLMIWKWTKRTQQSIDALRSTLFTLSEAHLSAIKKLSNHAARSTDIRAHETTVDCPQCGGSVIIPTDTQEGDVLCPHCAETFIVH